MLNECLYFLQKNFLDHASPTQQIFRASKYKRPLITVLASQNLITVSISVSVMAELDAWWRRSMSNLKGQFGRWTTGDMIWSDFMQVNFITAISCTLSTTYSTLGRRWLRSSEASEARQNCPRSWWIPWQCFCFWSRFPESTAFFINCHGRLLVVLHDSVDAVWE